MVTMEQIDAAREVVENEIEAQRVCRSVRTLGGSCGADHPAQIQRARIRVEALLREGWKQGCRAEPNLTHRVLHAEEEARRATARANEATDAMQTVVDRCRGACAAPPGATPSDGNDWVDEVIDLLRVTRGQRDDAQLRAEFVEAAKDEARTSHAEALRARAAEKSLSDERNVLAARAVRVERLLDEALGALRSVRQDYAVAAQQIEWDRKEIERLEQAATDAAIIARADHLRPPGGEEIFATRKWVEKKVYDAIRRYATDPSATFVGKLRCK